MVALTFTKGIVRDVRLLSLGASSYSAAFVLGALTVTVFYMLQNFGPESAIRRFHHGAGQGDFREMARVTLEDPSSPSFRFLANLVREHASRGAQVRLSHVERRAGRAFASVDYIMLNQYYPMTWIVDRKQAGWFVNATETCALLTGPMGAPRLQRPTMFMPN